MKRTILLWVLAPAALLYLTLTSALPASRYREPEVAGCSVKLSSASIDLVFPDGSILRTSSDFDRLNLDGVKASGGMADNLLREAFVRLGNESKNPAGAPRRSYLDHRQPTLFNPATVIDYSVTSGKPRVSVRLEVFNLQGRLVRTLVDTLQRPGEYSYLWQGYDASGQELESGVYFCRLRAGCFVATQKILLVK